MMMKKTKTSLGIVVLAVALVAGMTWSPPAQASEPYIGQIIMFGGNFAIRGYATCDGQLLAISQYTALYSILGITYGGDGVTAFALPDLRGRFPMHQGYGFGLSYRPLGQKSGTETNTLTVNQLPAHNHPVSATVKASSGQGSQEGPGGHVLAYDHRETQYSDQAPDVDMAAASVEVAVGNTGGNQAVNNMPPYLVINFQIALWGVYPSRD
ncbi:MAG: phage tail protein [Syntrophaceae bacterium]|nr:phage tail protein [Syntrophaceae bacterium]